jgi:hypothetical protein
MIPIERQALDILKEYNGINDYILDLKKDYLKGKLTITRNQSIYVIRHHQVQPKIVKKVVEIYRPCQVFIQEQLKLEFRPAKIYIDKLLSRKDDILQIWGCFGDNCDNHQVIFIPKECIKKTKEVPVLDFSGYEREPKPHQITAIKELLRNEKFILADDMGLGKFLDNETLIYTPLGTKKMGEIIIGDEVIGSNGKACKVIGVFPQGKKETYKITFNDGYSILAGDEHLWSVTSPNYGKNTKNERHKKSLILSTKQMYKGGKIKVNGEGHNKHKDYEIETYYKSPNGNNKWQIPIVEPIQFENNYELPIDPYLLGLSLGDGSYTKNGIRFSQHKDDYEELFRNFNLTEYKSDENKRSGYIKIDKLLVELELYDKRSHNKFIPNIYKYTSIENRLAILQGLMDTDGHCMKSKNSNFRGTEFSTISEKLCDDVCEIVQTLGGIARKKSRKSFYKKNGEKIECNISYRVNIKLPLGMNPFRLKRKAVRYIEPKKYPTGRYITNIEKYSESECTCISVDAPDKLYVAEHAIVTHNTTSAIIAAIEGNFKKILVVCPASLKLNWKKEIMNYDIESNISIVDSVDFRVNKWTIINYDILKNFHDLPTRGVKSDDEISPIDFYKFDLVIADEAHYLKNSTSNRTKIFNDFASRIPNRWLLTGTPITNKPIDFYNLLKICESPIASNWVHFVRRYCAGKQINRKGSKQKFWLTSGASNLDELKDYSSEVMLRRTKKDSIDLPQKTIKPIYLPITYCTGYNDYIKEYELWIEEMEAAGEKPTMSDHLTKLIKVRQLLSHDKIDHTIKLAEDLIENDHKVIIFSCFTQTINTIHEHFGKSSVIIDGSVSKEKRNLAVEKFQNDEKIKVFCGNIVAAGVGLTLTEGSIVIFNDLDWTPANHAQAEDRAHRMGQVNDVHIIYPLFDETLDVMMFDTLRKKMKIINQVMGDEMLEDDLSMGKDVVSKLMKH